MPEFAAPLGSVTGKETAPTNANGQIAGAQNDLKSTQGERFANATSLSQYYYRLYEEDQMRAKQRVKVQGQVDGNPPYDPAKLRDQGQAWRSNVNAREAEAIRNDNASALWSLLFTTPQLIALKATAKLLDQIQPALRDQMDEWALIIAENYTDMLMRWDDFYFNVMLNTNDIVTFGLGPMVWPDEIDWRFKSIPHASMLLSPRSKASLDQQTCVFLRDSLSLSQCLGIIENEDLSTSRGWDVEKMKEAVVRRFAANDSPIRDGLYQKSYWESFQQQIKNSDTNLMATWDDGLFIVRALVKEGTEGKISHYIIQDFKGTQAYLQKSVCKYDSMRNILGMIFFNIGDGYVRSVRGQSQMAYPLVELSTRFFNTTMDAAMLSGSIIVTNQGSDSDDMRLIRMGPITRLPKNVSPVQTSFAPRLDQMISMRGMTNQILNNNTGVYKRQMEQPGERERTATEVQTQTEKEGMLLNYQVLQFYIHWRRVHAEIIRRLLAKDYPESWGGGELRKEFMSKCVAMGVPKQLLESDYWNVDCVPAIGNGSGNRMAAITRELVNMSGQLDERGRNNATRDHVASLVGWSLADRYASAENRDAVPSQATNQAGMENNFFALGKPVEPAADDWHMVHIAAHLQPLMEVARAWQAFQSGQGQQMDPTNLVTMFGMALQHIGLHIQYVSANKWLKGLVNQLKPTLKQLADVYVSMNKYVENQQKQQMAQQQQQQQAMAAAQQGAQGLTADQQIRMKEVEGELQIKSMKAQGDIQIRRDKMIATVQLLREKAGVETQGVGGMGQ